MDDNRKKNLESEIQELWKLMESYETQEEESVPAGEALADRLALGRRIGRLYLSFARVLMEKLGQEKGISAILEAIRDYSYHCAQARKRGEMDLPPRGIFEKSEICQVNGKKSMRIYGCSIAEEFKKQDSEKIGSLYCYVDPCSALFTTPNIKLCHQKMKPLGDEFCEMDFEVGSDEEMRKVYEKGRDYSEIDPLIKKMIDETLF